MSFKKTHCLGHLHCVQWLWELCVLYLSQWNLLVWWKHSYSSCRLDATSPFASSFGCKFYHAPPFCIAGCNGKIYYVVHKLHFLSKATIHLGVHNHPIVDGKCKESLEETKRLIIKEVNCTPNVKMYVISLSANKTFFAKHLLDDYSDGKV